MPSFEEFLAAAKEKVQTPGFNRAQCGLLVKLLEDLIACIEKGTITLRVIFFVTLSTDLLHIRHFASLFGAAFLKVNLAPWLFALNSLLTALDSLLLRNWTPIR